MRSPSRRPSRSTARAGMHGKATCILLGNVGDLFGGVEAFEDASPDDGMPSRESCRLRVSRNGLGRSRGRRWAPRTSHRSSRSRRLAPWRSSSIAGAVRARRRRPREGEEVHGKDRAGRDQGLRADEDGTMSTAARGPETWELTVMTPARALASVGRVRLLRDSFQRLRAADGFSHARSLAFVTSLVLVQGIVVLVGFASAFGSRGSRPRSSRRFGLRRQGRPATCSPRR